MRPELKNNLLFLVLATTVLFNMMKSTTALTKFKIIGVFTHQTFGFFFDAVVFQLLLLCFIATKRTKNKSTVHFILQNGLVYEKNHVFFTTSY